ncbi:tetratricopeptide repeat protein [Nodosilinea sp. LEGE 07088]|uniref:tetratricopeptide repeat protein n=1 Tax=Nodosilinea sp. LEGE 07088 TaxID=2777968 RepID=UPI001A046E54|nr:tetratricopeptide repeat protein [Nodosilinea sp. LEGE 07088]MBE9140198.1 tetratricopeptide repeat protein [Nodosilinea sp. LEGE 07088]
MSAIAALLTPLISLSPQPTYSTPAAAKPDPAARLEVGDRLRELGHCRYQVNQFAEAVTSWQQALKFYQNPEVRSVFFQKSRQREASVLNLLAIVYRRLNRHQEAMSFDEQRLIIAREIGDRSYEASALISLGPAYTSSGQYRAAIDLLEQSLVTARQIGDQQREMTTLECLGLAHMSLNQYLKASNFYTQQLALALETNDQEMARIALNGLGTASLSLGRSQPAAAFDEKNLAETGLKLNRNSKDRLPERMALDDLGHAYFDVGDVGQHQGDNTQALCQTYHPAQILRPAPVVSFYANWFSRIGDFSVLNLNPSSHPTSW